MTELLSPVIWNPCFLWKKERGRRWKYDTSLQRVFLSSAVYSSNQWRTCTSNSPSPAREMKYMKAKRHWGRLDHVRVCAIHKTKGDFFFQSIYLVCCKDWNPKLLSEFSTLYIYFLKFGPMLFRGNGNQIVSKSSMSQRGDVLRFLFLAIIWLVEKLSAFHHQEREKKTNNSIWNTCKFYSK